MAEQLKSPPPAPDKRPVAVRPAYPRDAPLLYRWRSEPSVRRYQPLNRLTVGQLRAELTAQSLEDLCRGRIDKFQWIIEAPRPAGWVTLVVANWEHGLAEIGYALGTVHQRRGIMVAALGTLLDDLFARTRLRRIEARCAVDNYPSQRVLERLGFEREGRLRGFFVLRGQPVDNYLYALLGTDWQGR